MILFAFLMLIFFIRDSISVHYGDARIGDMTICKGKNYTLTGEFSVKNLTDGQAVKGTMYMSEEFGNDNRYSCKAFKVINGKRKLIVNIAGRGACNALNTYGAKMWWDVEKMLGNEKPSACPVAVKPYAIDWYKIKYSEMPILTLAPDGTYLVDCTLMDIKGKLIKACLSMGAMKTSGSYD